MASVNKVILVGNLGKDPELRYSGNGTPVVNMSIATNEQWKNARGDTVKKTTWHRIVLWKRLAEVAAEFLHKGSQVYIEGRLDNNEWEDKEGIKRYTTEIVANALQLLGAPPSKRRDSNSPPPPTEEPITIPEDDIPF